jgi:hypothetical protein
MRYSTDYGVNGLGYVWQAHEAIFKSCRAVLKAQGGCPEGKKCMSADFYGEPEDALKRLQAGEPGVVNCKCVRCLDFVKATNSKSSMTTKNSSMFRM